MDAAQTRPEVRRNESAARYEAWAAGRLLGIVTYRQEGDRVALPHTEVLPEVEGRGVGTALVQGTLDDLRARAVQVVPLCPFVAAYLRKHPEYQDLVPASHRSLITGH